MHLIEVTPVACLVCGRGNVQDDRDPLRFVDLERDVNWNDPAIICEDCVAQAGGMVGMLSKDTLNELRVEIQKRDREIHELKAEMDTMRRRAKKLGIEFVEAAA